ncbi:hypothetical protein [Skermanella pratensis]|uniref:hypothetical protein n=1 Tax=Skermanella pratensis TaxID=2233999 RepID=UPI0013013184|nr:hypothetical protein [Skermanella pratensis]
MSLLSSLAHIRLPRLPGFHRSRRAQAAHPDGRDDAPETCSADPIGRGEGFRDMGEFGGDVLEALIAEAGGGGGVGGDLEFDSDVRRQGTGAEASRSDWGPDYGAAGSAVAALDVRTLATRMAMALGGDPGVGDGFFDADSADGWSDLLQGDAGPAGGMRFGGGGAGVGAVEDGAEPVPARRGALPTLRGRGCLPDLGDALAADPGLRDRAAAFSTAGAAGTDTGLLTALEDRVTGVLYGWAGLEASPGHGSDGREAAFLEKYFGADAAGGITEALSPDAISEVFDQVRDAAILKLTGQGCLSGLFRNLAYDPKADRLIGSAVIDHDGLAAFGGSAANLGPDGEAGAWQTLAALTRGFEAALGEADALPSLLTAVRDRGADLAGRVGQGLRTLGIDVDSVKLKLPGGDEETDAAELQSHEVAPGRQDAEETTETLDWGRHDARQDWSGAGADHSGERHDAGAFTTHHAMPDMFAFTGMPIFDCFFQPRVA